MTAPARSTYSLFGIVRAALACTLSMLVLDLLFLGVVARGVYDQLLGPLKRDPVHWPAALLFYAMYVGAIVVHAVLPSSSAAGAARRGAGLGFVAYATYELTNWAVIAGWPAALVPLDLAWGVVLTAVVSAFGRRALDDGRTTPVSESR
jgi:uncharacterized membrane protein